MALRGINRTAWDTKLLLTAVLAHPVDSISSCQIALLFESEWLLQPAFSSSFTPIFRLPPIDLIRDIRETEKNCLKTR